MDQDDDSTANEYVNHIELTTIRNKNDEESFGNNSTSDISSPLTGTSYPPYNKLDDPDSVGDSGSLNEVIEGTHTMEDTDSKTDLKDLKQNPKKIDFILTYDEAKNDINKIHMRQSFEENIKSLGISLSSEKSDADHLTYIKLYTPFEVLCRGAQLLRIKKPIKHDAINMDDGPNSCLPCCRNKVNSNEYVIAQVFDARKKEKFDIKDPETFFTDAERIYITYCLLRKTEYKYKNGVHRGIDCLINDGAYADAFPLHEPLPDEPSETHTDINDRSQLRNNWASIKCIFKHQPIDLIRRYFGEQFTLYFTWLGVYTSFLIPATLFGIAAFIYGLVTFTEATRETCNTTLSNFYVCPKCDKLCDYTLFSEGCTLAKFTTVFDNELTPAVAFLICLWGIMFGEFWTRKQNLQMTRWHVTEFEEDENVRPEYASKVKSTKKNRFTGEDEPYLPFFHSTIRFGASISIICFLICVVVISIFGILVYRLAIVYALYQYGGDDDNVIKTNAKMITTITAAILNVIAITILGLIYSVIARLLTDLETHRTQSAYEDSYTFKIIVFQFINNYGSLFYIAFFKGSFVDRPGHNYLYMFGKYKQDECAESGCFSELTIQLIIILLGKQLIGAVIEMLIPTIKRFWKSRNNKDKSNYKQWEKDNDLAPLDKIPMFSEYLEMIMQYGFIIMFVAAFPLAPLFALINNLFEIRLDALKAVSLERRTPGIKAQDIGAWQYIVTCFTYFGIVTNAFIIAWTSEFIPKSVYRWYRADRSLDGYNQWSMATFDVSRFQNTSYIPPDSKLFPFSGNITSCRYRTFVIPAFELSSEHEVIYWHIFCARWAFVIVFEHICVIFMGLIQAIPDVTSEAQTIKKYEKYAKSNSEVENLFKKYGAQRTKMANLAAFFPDDPV